MQNFMTRGDKKWLPKNIGTNHVRKLKKIICFPFSLTIKKCIKRKKKPLFSSKFKKSRGNAARCLNLIINSIW